MFSDEVYELCLPILRDDSLEDEEKIQKMEDLLRNKASLTGKSLENAVLDALWNFHNSNSPSNSPPPPRITIIRRPSPAPWQIARTSTPSNSPAISGFGAAPPGFRAKSSVASPFSSPRPSPQLTFSSPHIPHSPSLNKYEFNADLSCPTSNQEIYGDYGSDNVDWLVNNEAGNNYWSYACDATLNGNAAEWVQSQTMDMSPYDMLRSILQDEKSDEELDKALEENSYDLSATIMSLMGPQELDEVQATPAVSEPERTFVIGKSMSPTLKPPTPPGQTKTSVICKYWLSTGHCARADCRFSHDPSKMMCKYWMMGNCLAGDSCMFSHDPSGLMARIMIENGANQTQPAQSTFQLQDHESFPSLQPLSAQHWNSQPPAHDQFTLEQIYHHSRPSSRQQSRADTPPIPAVDDNEAFPSLGSAATAKSGKRNNAKLGCHIRQKSNGSNSTMPYKENDGPTTLADVVRMIPPSPSLPQLKKTTRTGKPPNGNSKENSAAAQAIQAPVHVPWLQTGEMANRAYLKARQEAFKHGALRNKFLQSAGQAWNRNDSRAAKALSLRGQNENNLMRAAHREAAKYLCEERNKNNSNSQELYIDLHGLHPEEAIVNLYGVLEAHSISSRPVYAITGTGHHSKNGKDKLGKAVRLFLNEYRYAFKEFSVPGDRGNVGGILGIDPSSWDQSIVDRSSPGGTGNEEGRDSADKRRCEGKIRVVKDRDVPRRRKGVVDVCDMINR